MMAGIGAAPKNPGNVTVWKFTPGIQPDLPPMMPGDMEWPQATRDWWDALRDYPLSAEWSDVEWLYHLDTAVMHGKYWVTGSAVFASELRLRLAKIGATAEDRARLRVAFAQADAAGTEQQVAPRQTARDKFAGLTTVPRHTA